MIEKRWSFSLALAVLAALPSVSAAKGGAPARGGDDRGTVNDRHKDGRHDRDSDYFLSVVDAGSARQLFNEVGDTFNEARSGYIEATGLYRKDDNDEALAAVDSALELMNSLLNEVDIAFALRLRSQVLQSLKRRDEAAITLRNAMELFESNDLKSMAGICALDIGEIHGSADRLREALETFEKALELFIAESDLVGTGRAHDRIASALISMGNFDEAIVHLRESLHTFEFINEESRIAYAQYRLGWTLVSNGEHIEAMPLLEQASQWYKAASRWGDAADVDHQIAHMSAKLLATCVASKSWTRLRPTDSVWLCVALVNSS
jgi:tetratricopeptide (TPR) repeat protein